eukprot:scaffold2619_cov129-Cylindrotheca_fusiformis.AAC.12
MTELHLRNDVGFLNESSTGEESSNHLELNEDCVEEGSEKNEPKMMLQFQSPPNQVISEIDTQSLPVPNHQIYPVNGYAELGSDDIDMKAAAVENPPALMSADSFLSSDDDSELKSPVVTTDSLTNTPSARTIRKINARVDWTGLQAMSPKLNSNSDVVESKKPPPTSNSHSNTNNSSVNNSNRTEASTFKSDENRQEKKPQRSTRSLVPIDWTRCQQLLQNVGGIMDYLENPNVSQWGGNLIGRMEPDM